MSAFKKIGFIGTGIMGSHMARRLAQAGYSVAAWNRTAEKARRLSHYGVRFASKPENAASEADIVICMLSSDAACQEVLPAILDTLAPNSLLLVMSSISVAAARKQAQDAQARGIRYLDAPVSGGEAGTRDGKLAIMAGGNAATFEDALPVFQILGRPTLVGEAGSGSLAKLANQMIVAGTIALIAEAFTLAKEGGVHLDRLREALNGGFADSPILEGQGLRMIEQNFTPGGPAKYQIKDSGAALSLAQSMHLTLPISETVDHLFRRMVEAGDGELDHTDSQFRTHTRKRNPDPVSAEVFPVL
ncbi:NAD(P)-dependent oxidoreductase [Kozakia baliensis]|uniref:NAD(P)-dependent oxidoreductase n=1 Tax=Kozakia baliensis TaxID=153496 RepID=UPI0004954515|nr:NAD(P)-dependent oxidoreductase [Kozakia baliensis]